MNLTDIMLFGKAIIGDGGSGGAIAIHRNCTIGELMQSESFNLGDTYYKISDKVPTYDQFANSVVFSKNYNGQWIITKTMAMEDGGIAALMAVEENGNPDGLVALAITPELAEMLKLDGIECSAGLYTTGQCFAYSKFDDELGKMELDFYMVLGVE